MYKLIKCIFLFSFLNIYVLMGQKTEDRGTYITSDQTEYVDTYPNITSEFPTYIYEWRKMPSLHRSTVIGRNTEVNFQITGETPNATYEWKIYRASRDVEEFDASTKKYKVGIVDEKQAKKKVSIKLLVGDPGRRARRFEEIVQVTQSKLSWTFDKLSKDNLIRGKRPKKKKGKKRGKKWNHLISDLYVVNLYENGTPIDFMYVFVLPEGEIDYVEGFDIPVGDPDGAGKFQPEEYPEWSGHGYNLVEHADGLEHFGVIFEGNSRNNKTRKGTGMVKNTIPAISELAHQSDDSKDKYWSRSTRNAIIHYPNNTNGTDIYYGVSLKIPKNQDWSWITKHNDSVNRYVNTVILLDIHTAHFPNRELWVNEGASLHINYLGENLFGLNYGIAKVDKFQKHFYLNNHKDRWVDFIFRYRFKNVSESHLTRGIRNLNPEDGIFEMWVSIGNENFKKMKFEENTFPKNVKINGEFNPEKRIAVPKISNDGTTVFGPNIVNTNPLYFGLTQYRIGNKGPAPIDISNTVYYDEFITSGDLNKVLDHFGKKVDGASEFSKE